MSKHLLHVVALAASLSCAAAPSLGASTAQEPAPAAEAPVQPEADPADVESLDAIVAALYDVISGDKGEARDWDRFRSLFHPELGRLTPLRPDPAAGTWRAMSMSPEDYVANATRWTATTAFYEREIARRTERFGGLAHVWTTYEGFNAKGATEPFVRGINSVQLMNDGARWWILTISWDAERPDQPLPERYLAAAAPPTLILTGGRVVAVDDAGTEAEAIAIAGDRVLVLGSEEEILALAGDGTRVVDLDGRLAIPGFIEGHGHFLGVGDSAMQLDLRGARTWDEIVAMVAAAARELPPGTLIRGRGWHQEKWTTAPDGAVEGLPRHDALSAVSPEHPVILTHASGHATFANALAMRLAGIDADSVDPEGGEIVRDASGSPIGALRETASGLLRAVYLRARPRDPEEMARFAAAECLRKGVTSFQDAGSSFEDAELLARMARAGALDVRVWMMLREPVAELRERLPAAKVTGVGGHRFTVGGIKRSIDGALGSHGAWLLQPYADLPASAGLNTVPVEDVEACAALALEHGLQLCVHAIGDRANREVLDLYERFFAAHPDRTDLRWRIEHAQHLHPADVPRFGALGVIPAMQGVHCTSDAPWVLRRLGEERAESGAYLWRALLDSGAVVTNGTDAPVEDVDPLVSFRASVTRRLPDGSTFFPGQRMTRMEALRSYTLSNAYAAFEEDLKGSLEPGKLADVVVLSTDVLACPEDELADAHVDLTVVGGQVLYERD